MNTRKAAMRAASVCLKAAILIVIALGIVYLGKLTYGYTRAVFCDAAIEEKPGKAVHINVPENISSKKFAKVLEKNGLIKDADTFYIQMKLEDFGGTVKAGSYELNTSMKPTEMLKSIAAQAEDQEI